MRAWLKTDHATVLLWHNYEKRAVLWQADLHFARRAGLVDARRHLPNIFKFGFTRGLWFQIHPFNRSLIAVWDQCI